MRVLNTQQMREADRRTIEDVGIASIVLMENAGRQAVAAMEAAFEDLLARDVVIEARLLNAGASQDVELSAFFAEISPGDPIPQIAPYARVPLRSAVRLTRDAIREYEIEGRKLFVPLIAVNVRYRWSSGEGQSAAGFLVGQSGEGKEKLAPLRIDKGDRSLAEQVRTQGLRRDLQQVRQLLEFREAADQAAQPVHALGVEAVGGLVEDQHLGVAEQRLRDAEALAHAERVVAHPAVGLVVGEADQLEHLLDAALGQAHGALHQGEDLAAGAAGVLGGGVEQDADVASGVGDVS